METVITSPRDGTIAEVLIEPGTNVTEQDLLIVLI